MSMVLTAIIPGELCAILSPDINTMEIAVLPVWHATIIENKELKQGLTEVSRSNGRAQAIEMNRHFYSRPYLLRALSSASNIWRESWL